MGQQLYQRLPQAFVEEVLEAFNDQRMTERQACELLGLKRARLYRIRQQWLRRRGTWTLTAPHRRGRGWPAEIQDWLHEECRYLRDGAEAYKGRFNFEVLAEAAHRRFGRRLSGSGVRRWAIREGYYQRTRGEVGKVYVRWESPGPGALWQHDTSHHRWLPQGEGYQDLIVTQDDYSRQIVGWRLESQERVWHHLEVVQGSVARWGCPLAYYVDEHGFFRYVARSSAWRRYRTPTDEGQAQVRRALQSLGIGVIYAHSPQAKGKIEKRFDYLQRRLPARCERYGITTVEAARPIVEELVGYYNEQRRHRETGEIPAERWARGVREGRSRLRPLPADIELPLVCAVQHERVVHSDGKVQFQGQRWPVSAPPESRVTVCWRPAEALVILWNGRRVGEYQL